RRLAAGHEGLLATAGRLPGLAATATAAATRGPGTLAAPARGRGLGRQHGHACGAGVQDVVEAMVEHEVAHVALLGTLEVLDLEVVDDVAIAAAPFDRELDLDALGQLVLDGAVPLELLFGLVAERLVVGHLEALDAVVHELERTLRDEIL